MRLREGRGGCRRVGSGGGGVGDGMGKAGGPCIGRGRSHRRGGDLWVVSAGVRGGVGGGRTLRHAVMVWRGDGVVGIGNGVRGVMMASG